MQNKWKVAIKGLQMSVREPSCPETFDRRIALNPPGLIGKVPQSL